MSARLVLFLAAASISAVACDNDTTAPQAPTTSFDAGQGGQGTDGGSGISPTPGPGPVTLGLKLPEFYALVTGLSGITSSGFSISPIAAGNGQPVYPEDLQRVVFQFVLNGSAQGRKAGAIPVFIHSATRPSPNVGFEPGKDFVCAQERSGSSGRKYRVLEKTAVDPMTNGPYAQNLESCSWFLVEVELAGRKRYKPMIFLDGAELYLAGTPSDTTSGSRAHVGSTLSDGAPVQLLSPDHTGPVPN